MITMRYELLSKNYIGKHWTVMPICSYHFVKMVLMMMDEYVDAEEPRI